MKIRLFIFAIIFITVFSSPEVYSVQNTSVYNPAGAMTTPPSEISNYTGYSSVTSQQYDFNGNDIITGNVRSGKSFQGVVPYSSTSSFSSTLGTSTLSSFLRDSAGSEDLSSIQSAASTGNYQSYYLPSQTVSNAASSNTVGTNMVNSTVASGTQQNVFNSQTSASRTEATSLDISTQSAKWQLYNQGSAIGQPQNNTISQSLNLLQSPVLTDTDLSGQTDLSRQYSGTSAEQYQNQLQSENTLQDMTVNTAQPSSLPQYDLYTQNSAQLSDTTSEIQQSTAIADISDSLNTLNTQINTPEYQQQNNNISSTSDILNDIQKQLDELIRSLDADLQEQTTASDISEQGIPQQTTGMNIDYQTALRPQYVLGTSDNISSSPEIELPDISIPEQEISSELIDSSLNTDLTSLYELESSSEVVLGPHQDYEHLNQAKFNDRYWAAQEHLNAGRYKEAIDYFTRAQMYRPEEPLCLAGKAHALFGAGEYVSSSLDIIKAVELCPEYLSIDVDISNILSDKLDHAQKMLVSSKTPGLNFLLGYALFRAGMYDKALQAAQDAQNGMPDSKAPQTLINAIRKKSGSL